jgi:hypothetical protein
MNYRNAKGTWIGLLRTSRALLRRLSNGRKEARSLFNMSLKARPPVLLFGTARDQALVVRRPLAIYLDHRKNFTRPTTR